MWHFRSTNQQLIMCPSYLTARQNCQCEKPNLKTRQRKKREKMRYCTRRNEWKMVDGEITIEIKCMLSSSYASPVTKKKIYARKKKNYKAIQCPVKVPGAKFSSSVLIETFFFSLKNTQIHHGMTLPLSEAVTWFLIPQKNAVALPMNFISGILSKVSCWIFTWGHAWAITIISAWIGGAKDWTLIRFEWMLLIVMWTLLWSI